MRNKVLTALAVSAALLGLLFATVSTRDFVAHLDRDTHGLHCSFLPGASVDVSGSSGCHATLMSPYSSVFRTSVWGGIPISLPAVSVYAFLAVFGMILLLSKKTGDKRAMGFFFLAALVPTLASAAMGYLAAVELKAACKLCIGMYSASFLLFVFTLMAWLGIGNESVAPATSSQIGADETVPDVEFRKAVAAAAPRPVSYGTLAMAFAVGVAFVGIPVAAYASLAPDFSSYLGSCGSLTQMRDADGVMVALGPQVGTPMIEVLDPLCNSCRGFENRLSKIEARDHLARKALLFPLDPACNWMISEQSSVKHLGSCAVSEAIFCAGDQGDAVLQWAFAHQEEIMQATAADRDAAARMVRAQFPSVASCVGSPSARAKVNRSLRFAVANQMPLLTPQVYVNGTRLCDSDTDIGLDYMLTRLSERASTPAAAGAR